MTCVREGDELAKRISEYYEQSTYLDEDGFTSHFDMNGMADHVRAFLRERMPKPVDKITAAVRDWQDGRNHGLAEVRRVFGIEGKEGKS